MNQKIVITGANGMLGGALCEEYQGYNSVYAFHRDCQCLASCIADCSFELSDTIKLQTYFNQIKPDLVIHCVGLINMELCEKKPGLAYKSNVILTENIAKYCPAGAKLVYISTDQVYSGTKDHNEQNTHLQPLNQYGKTKLQGELKVLQLNFNSIIVRTNIFGWNIKPARVSSAEWVYHSLKYGREITLFTDYTFSPIYTKELATIIMNLVEQDFSGIVNIGSWVPCTKYEFGIKLAETSGYDHLLIKKGTLQNHHFQAPRSNDLTLPTKKLASLGVRIPDYKSSVNAFLTDRLTP